LSKYQKLIASSKTVSIALALTLLRAFGVISCQEKLNDGNEPTVTANTESFLKFENQKLNHVNTSFIKTEKDEGYVKPFHIMTTAVNAKNFGEVF